MAFKLKDLMINLIPQGVGKGRPGCAPASGVGQFCGTPSAGAGFCGTPSAGAAGFCGTPSAGAAGFCGTPSAGAAFCGTPSAGAAFCGTPSAGVAAGDPRAALEGLVLLKQQLLHALAQVEEQEKALEDACRPQSLEEAEELERHLRGALEELEEHKRNLRGK